VQATGVAHSVRGSPSTLVTWQVFQLWGVMVAIHEVKCAQARKVQSDEQQRVTRHVEKSQICHRSKVWF
jgi:hypothetical protein